jgi:hypothetical protein
MADPTPPGCPGCDSLRHELAELRLELQRLDFAYRRERELKKDAYDFNRSLHFENARLTAILDGRIRRGRVDPTLLVRALVESLVEQEDHESVH